MSSPHSINLINPTTSMNVTDSLKNLSNVMKNLDERFQSYFIYVIIFIVILIYGGYLYYLSILQKRECNFMNNLYPDMNGFIIPISDNSDAFSHKLFDYYIKTAYNSCSGGSYKNGYVDICHLKAILKQGVRCLDFEIYSIDDNPVVSTSTEDSYFVKETFNYVPFGDSNESVMEVINNYAFASGTCPNHTDPLIIHLRIKSTNVAIYDKLAKIFSSYEKMLGPDYSYENTGKNIGLVPLLELKNKIILIVDRTNTTYLESIKLLEFINLTSNSVFMRKYHYYDILNNPDVMELTDYNRSNMSIVIPDKGISPANPSGPLCRNYGCQMVAMRYQYVDDYLMENAAFFDEAGTAFALKPPELRYRPVIIPEPRPQNPEYNYATRNIRTPYYTYKI
jgi:hypothetical protein